MDHFVTPVLKVFLICDRVIQDKIDNKYSAIGVFDNIITPSFPCTHIGFGLLMLLTNACGKYTFTIDLVHSEDEEVVAKIEFGELEIKDAVESSNIGFNFPPLTFKQPGRYEFRLFANGHFVERRDMSVLPSKGA